MLNKLLTRLQERFTGQPSASTRKGKWPGNKGDILSFDPTYGKVDHDIQWHVHDHIQPTSVGQRVAFELELQRRRDENRGKHD